jgi:CBS domain containing-hemolysin-like protein
LIEFQYLLFAPVNPTAEPTGTISGLLLYIVIALGFSFMCSMWEAGLLSSSASYVETIANEGNPAGKIMRRLKENVDRPIAAILTLNTVAHTVGAAGAGAQAAGVFGNEWFALISLVLTVLILVFSEIIPKTLGAVYWRQLLAFNAYSIQALVIVLFPLVWVFQQMTNVISHGEAGDVVTRGELETMAQMGSTSGTIAESDYKILKNLLRLDEVQVSAIMTPRPVVLALQQDMTVSEVMAQSNKIPYSRIPIYDENADDIVAFVLRHDVLAAAARDEHKRTLREFKREIISVPETISVARVMTELINKQHHIALVFDEYGGTAGIITMEDAIESLLGAEITDESDLVDDLRLLAQQRSERQREILGLFSEASPNGSASDQSTQEES